MNVINSHNNYYYCTVEEEEEEPPVIPRNTTTIHFHLQLGLPSLVFTALLTMMILSVVIPIVGGEPIQPMLNAAIAPAVAANTNSTLNSTIITGQQSAVLEDCKAFTFGISNTEFTSPLYPNNYPDNIDCVRVIAATPGHRIQIRIIESFQMEESPGCKYDYFEARNGEFSYSTQLARVCGNIPPTPILGTGHYMWLKFHSDGGINYGGFKALITMVPSSDFTQPSAECKAILAGEEGDFKSDDLMANVPLSEGATTCAWVIETAEEKRISLKFEDYKLQRPNDCSHNFVEVYRTREDYDGRATFHASERGTQKFCGTQTESVKSIQNFLAVRFFAVKFDPSDAKRATFKANFTIYRELSKTISPPEVCDKETEFACGDLTCISKELRCNHKYNCDSRTDEEKCPSSNKAGLTPDILVIGLVGCILIFGMCAGMILNIYRKLKQDREEISELKESLKKYRDSESEINKIRQDPSSTGGSGPGPSTSSRTSTDSKITILERKPQTLPSYSTANAVPSQPPSSVPISPAPQIPPNGDIKPVLTNKPLKTITPIDTVALITYAPPAAYPSKVSIRPKVSVAPEEVSSVAVGTDDISSLASSSNKNDIEEVIEVRDVACQTRNLGTTQRDFGFGRRRAPLAREDAVYEIMPVQKKVARRFSWEAMPTIPSFSSASSETGRSLERLDELAE